MLIAPKRGATGALNERSLTREDGTWETAWPQAATGGQVTAQPAGVREDSWRGTQGTTGMRPCCCQDGLPNLLQCHLPPGFT